MLMNLCHCALCACYLGIRLFNMQSVLAGYLFNGTRFNRVSIMYNPLRRKKNILHSGNRTPYRVGWRPLLIKSNALYKINSAKINDFRLILLHEAGGVEMNIKIILLSEIRVNSIIHIACFQWYDGLSKVTIVKRTHFCDFFQRSTLKIIFLLFIVLNAIFDQKGASMLMDTGPSDSLWKNDYFFFHRFRIICKRDAIQFCIQRLFKIFEMPFDIHFLHSNSTKIQLVYVYNILWERTINEPLIDL